MHAHARARTHTRTRTRTRSHSHGDKAIERLNSGARKLSLKADSLATHIDSEIQAQKGSAEGATSEVL